MKRFKFTLQSLLNIRLAFEKQQKAELAEAEARLRRLNEELSRILMRYEAARREFSELKGDVTAEDFRMYAMGFTALRDRERVQRARIKACEKEVSDIRKKLVETMKDRKTLEKLKEKQLTEHLAEARREEDLAINEFVTNKVAVGGDLDG